MEQQKREIAAAAEDNKAERKAYVAPTLVEWGALAELTRGDAGAKQDANFTGTRTMF